MSEFKWKVIDTPLTGRTYVPHPTPDKLALAVEALVRAREDIIAFATARGSEYEGTREDATYEIDQALAAIKAAD